MAKRVRTVKGPSTAVIGCGLVPALRSVLFDRSLVCGLIASRAELTLTDLWNLYQTCSGTLNALSDYHDIVLYREARLYHHGELNHVLTVALKERRDKRLLRALRHCLQQRVTEFPRALSPGTYACGVSLHYLEFMMAQPSLGLE